MAGTAAPRYAPETSGEAVAIVVSDFHRDITEGLLSGALEAAREAGIDRDSCPVFRVPGAWELPVAAQTAAASERFSAVVALGCVVRGETPHFDYVAGEASRGLARIALEWGVPIGFGLLTTDTMEQAEARAKAGPENKGREAMIAALETAGVLRDIDAGAPRP